jgi:hypothetical protein
LRDHRAILAAERERSAQVDFIAERLPGISRETIRKRLGEAFAGDYRRRHDRRAAVCA